MSVVAVVGGQWGDEGKGKIVHLLSMEADWCVRFNGGTNAGHRVVFERVQATSGGSVSVPEEFRFHLVPSGALNPGCAGVLGNGMVIDPYALVQEIKMLQQAKGSDDPNLYFSEGAHLLLPYHPIVERMAGSSCAMTSYCLEPRLKLVTTRPPSSVSSVVPMSLTETPSPAARPRSISMSSCGLLSRRSESRLTR